MSSNSSRILIAEEQIFSELVMSITPSKFGSIFSFFGEYALIFFIIVVVRAWIMQYFSCQVSTFWRAAPLYI
jgi:hypothetical protein